MMTFQFTNRNTFHIRIYLIQSFHYVKLCPIIIRCLHREITSYCGWPAGNRHELRKRCWASTADDDKTWWFRGSPTTGWFISWSIYFMENPKITWMKTGGNYGNLHILRWHTDLIPIWPLNVAEVGNPQ